MSEKGRTAEGSEHTHVSVAVAAGQVQGRVAAVVLHVRAGFVVQQQQLREGRGKQVSSSTGQGQARPPPEAPPKVPRGGSFVSTSDLSYLYYD